MRTQRLPWVSMMRCRSGFRPSCSALSCFRLCVQGVVCALVYNSATQIGIAATKKKRCPCLLFVSLLNVLHRVSSQMCKVLQSFLDTCCAAFITLSSLERVADQLHPRTSSHGQKVQSGCCCQARQTSCPSQTPCFEAVLGVPESEVCSWRSRCAGSWHPLGPCDLESFHC